MGFQEYLDNLPLEWRTSLVFLSTCIALLFLAAALKLSTKLEISTAANVFSSIFLASAAMSSFYLAKEKWSKKTTVEGYALGTDYEGNFALKVFNTGDIAIPITGVLAARLRYDGKKEKFTLIRLNIKESKAVEPGKAKIVHEAGSDGYIKYEGAVNIDSNGDFDKLDMKAFEESHRSSFSEEENSKIFRWFLEELESENIEIWSQDHGWRVAADYSKDEDLEKENLKFHISR